MISVSIHAASPYLIRWPGIETLPEERLPGVSRKGTGHLHYTEMILERLVQLTPLLHGQIVERFYLDPQKVSRDLASLSQPFFS